MFILNYRVYNLLTCLDDIFAVPFIIFVRHLNVELHVPFENLFSGGHIDLDVIPPYRALKLIGGAYPLLNYSVFVVVTVCAVASI